MGYLRLSGDPWNFWSATQRHGLCLWRRLHFSPCSYHVTHVAHGQVPLRSWSSLVLFDGNTNSFLFQPLCPHETGPKKKVPAAVCGTTQTQNQQRRPTRSTDEFEHD